MWTIAIVLVAAHFIAGVTGFGKSFLHLSREQTIPTLFSTVLLLLAAVLLALIGQVAKHRGRPFVSHWRGLALVFTFLAIDETVGFHEQLIEPLRSAFDASGVLYYTWVVPYVIALLILVAFYIPFLFHLPRRTALGLVVAGTLYVLGAVVMESLTGLVVSSSDGERGIVFQALQAAEETLEIVGIVLFISVLLSYVETHLSGIIVHLASPAKIAEEKVVTEATD